MKANNLPEGGFIISFINELELLSYPSLTKSEENKIKDFIASIDVVDLNPSIKKETIRLRKKYLIKLPDAIICAAALSQEISLLTFDDQLFKIKELIIIKPDFV